jgi:hypothetical protein
MKTGFGLYAKHNMENLPLGYLCWLAKPTRFYKDKHSTDVTWKVPIAVQMEARRILEERGAKIVGERIENKEGDTIYIRR